MSQNRKMCMNSTAVVGDINFVNGPFVLIFKSFILMLQGEIQELLLTNDADDASLQCDEGFQRQVGMCKHR